MRVGRGGLNGSFGVGGLRRAGGERQRTLGRDTTRPVGRVRARFSRHGQPNCDCLSGERVSENFGRIREFGTKIARDFRAKRDKTKRRNVFLYN